MNLSRVLRVTVAVAAIGLLLPVASGASSAAQLEGAGSPNVRHVKNLAYTTAPGSTITNGGTDIEFATLQGRSYALAGSYKNGLQIIDITDPENASIASVYDCGVQQGDVQVFTREELGPDGLPIVKTYAGYTQDTGYTPTTTSRCYRDAQALGFKATTDKFGTFIVDITDPLAPTTVSFVSFPQGSHNHTIDPSGRYIYNSNSDLITSTSPAIEIADITNLSAPRSVGELPLPLIPGLGSESHDITFSADGTRAYSAALSHTNIIDTTNKEAPRIISTIVDPMINVHHQADPIRIKDKTTGQERSFVIIEDEFAGATGTGQCPNGGVHVWDVTDEARPVKVGFWNITDAGPTENNSGTKVGRCTAHVFDIHSISPTEAIMTIAYYNGGVRVVDMSGLVGVAIGNAGVGMKEVGWYRFPNGDTWAAKTPAIAADGSFYLYGNDQARGFDIYHYTKPTTAQPAGRWLSAAEAKRLLPVPRRGAAGSTPFCLIRKDDRAVERSSLRRLPSITALLRAAGRI